VRRPSLVAPLLLLALGALFLARNLYPSLPLGEYVARYWPYILIVWGAVRIGEICYWALTAKPLPARGFSGGEWVLVLFLCLIGMGIHVAQDGYGVGVSVNGPWMRWPIPWASMQVIGERYDYPINAEKASSKTPRIVIEDFRGDLQITGSDSDIVKVTGRKSIRAMEKNGAERADRNSAFEITGDADEMTLRLREGAGFARISSAIEMTVPKGASLEAKRRDGAVHISNVQGAVAVSGRAGDMDVHDVGGPVTIDGNFAGDVQLKNLAKAVRLKTPRTEFSAAAVPGEIHVDSGDFKVDGLTGPARLSSRSRDVHIRDFHNALEIDLDRGDLNLEAVQGPLSRIQATVRFGDVNLVLPENVGFSLQATTKNGEISNELGAAFKVDSDGRKQTLQGSTGTGPEITLEVERGNISVSRGSNKLPAKEAAHPLETIHQ
jgi:hypothetical protein